MTDMEFIEKIRRLTEEGLAKLLQMLDALEASQEGNE